MPTPNSQSSFLESASPIAAGISTGLGLLEGGFQFFHSLSDEKKASAELEQMRRPFYKIQDEFYQNRNMGAQLAQQGLTSTAKDYITSETERGLGSGIQALLASGGDAGDISKMFDTFGRTTFNTAAADSEAQTKNIQYFMDLNKDLAGQEITQWSLNELQPYEDKLAQLTERIAADKTNAYGGANTAIGSAAAGSTAMSNASLMSAQKAMYDRLFPTKTDPYTSMIDLNQITGGMSGNAGTLKAGSPFPIGDPNNIDPRIN